jgi:hypothetical protein
MITIADLTATRVITIHASADEIWPWIAQLGQGRGGFYSYDFIENLVGCEIQSSDRIVPEWQYIGVGDEVRLAPEVGLAVASVEQGRSLVLRGGIPIGSTAPPYDFTWAFVLREKRDRTTRLLVRERYAYTRPWARLIVEPTEVLSFAMSQKMLRGIKDRAERTVALRYEEISARGEGGRPQFRVGYLASLRLPFGRGACSSRETPSDGRAQSSPSLRDRCR